MQKILIWQKWKKISTKVTKVKDLTERKMRHTKIKNIKFKEKLTMTKTEMIKDLLENMSESQLYTIANEYFDKTEYYDDRIYDMEEFDEMMDDMLPSDIATKIFYGDFRPNDNYFKFDGYDNLQSFDYISDEVDLEEIADYIVDNDEDFDNSDIREILGEDDEEDEEEGDED